MLLHTPNIALVSSLHRDCAAVAMISVHPGGGCS